MNVEISNFISMVSFTRRCTLKVNEELRKIQSNDLIMYDTELSENLMRKNNILKIQSTKPLFTDDAILEMYHKLNAANITDLKIRDFHVEISKGKEEKDESIFEKSKVEYCKICEKEVSEKIKVFCLSNKGRFKGNIYCFEHQKSHL